MYVCVPAFTWGQLLSHVLSSCGFPRFPTLTVPIGSCFDTIRTIQSITRLQKEMIDLTNFRCSIGISIVILLLFWGEREKESRKENVEWSLVHHSDVTTVELIWKPAQTSNTAPIRDPIVWRGDCSLHNPVHNGTNTVFGKRFPLHLIILDFHQAKKRQLSLNNKVIIKSSELLIDLQQIGL